MQNNHLIQQLQKGFQSGIHILLAVAGSVIQILAALAAKALTVRLAQHFGGKEQ